MKKSYISVFLPTYNGEKYLGECIKAILNQELPKGYDLEFLITDSGSSDNSVAIIEQYLDRVTFNQIPNKDFGHGKTRQAAARSAKGDYILFITQDATPTNYQWIKNMLEPFFLSDKIGAVFGRQIPRPFSVPTIKREVSGVFNSFGAANSIVIHSKKSLTDGQSYSDYNYFFSDVNSAVRKDMIEKIPFRDVKYAEDMAFAEDLMSAGYVKAYSPRGAVWHSNEYTASEYYHRKFDEYLGLVRNGDQAISISQRELLLGWIRPTLADWSFVKKDREYNRRAKIKYLLSAPIYNINEKRGKADAIKYHNSPSEISNRSLEERNK